MASPLRPHLRSDCAWWTVAGLFPTVLALLLLCSRGAAQAAPGDLAPRAADGPRVSLDAGTDPVLEPDAQSVAPDTDAEPALDAGTEGGLHGAEAAATEPGDVGPPPQGPGALPPGERPEVVLRTVLGLLGLVILAYLGGHPVVLRWERRLGISQVVTAGFPFIVLGAIARLPAVGVLSETTLDELTPALRIGLAWIGLTVGLRLDAHALKGMPLGIGRVVLLTTLLPFAFLLVCCGVALASIEGFPLDARDPQWLRNALILAVAGTITSRTIARGAPGNPRALRSVTQLEELGGIAGLALVASFLRPQGPEVNWQLPGGAWLLLTVGLGTTVGLLVHVCLRGTRGRADFLVLSLGSVSFIAGAAGFLHVPAVTVAFVAGVILANFGSDYRERMRDLMERMERPVYLLSLLVVGALWRFDDWRGWLLVPVFVSMRLLGKAAALRLASLGGDPLLTPEDRRALAASPIGALAIAIVVSSRLLYPDSSISVVVTAVIGGGIITEIIVQITGRAAGRRPAARVPVPLDENPTIQPMRRSGDA